MQVKIHFSPNVEYFPAPFFKPQLQLVPAPPAPPPQRKTEIIIIIKFEKIKKHQRKAQPLFVNCSLPNLSILKVSKNWITKLMVFISKKVFRFIPWKSAWLTSQRLLLHRRGPDIAQNWWPCVYWRLLGIISSSYVQSHKYKSWCSRGPSFLYIMLHNVCEWTGFGSFRVLKC